MRVYVEESGRLILCKCVLSVCVSQSHTHTHTAAGTGPVLFGPAASLVSEGVTQRIAAAAKTACRPLDLDPQPAPLLCDLHH